jgi:hypothetical protein
MIGEVENMEGLFQNEPEFGDPIEGSGGGDAPAPEGAMSSEPEGDTFESLEFEMGEGDQVTKLTGKDILGWKDELDKIKADYATLQAERAAAPAPQPVIPQPAAIPQPVTDPFAELGTKAQQAMEQLLTGDMNALPAVLDTFRQVARLEAQGTTQMTVKAQEADRQFAAAHPAAPEVLPGGKLHGEFLNFMAKNPYYADGVQGFLAFELARANAAHTNETTALKNQIEQAGKAGEKTGAKNALLQGKARGILRLIGTGGARAAASAGKSPGERVLNGPVGNPDFVDDLAGAMAARLAELRGQAS